MSRGAARSVSLACACAVALAAVGCGDQKANDPRPPIAVETTVKVNDQEVLVSPNRFDYGQGEGLTTPANIVEAQAEARGEKVPPHTQTAPPTLADQPVVLTIVNLSNHPIALAIKGPTTATSARIAAGETGSLKVALRTGKYRVTALGLKSAKAGSMDIGPARHSSQNDLLLP
ncbi:MAG: hypothetical protein QOG09_1025 [Solirubrobacterales bacterium]|nr:hypothetical protein [Solirubrobacterales bacterium]